MDRSDKETFRIYITKQLQKGAAPFPFMPRGVISAALDFAVQIQSHDWQNSISTSPLLAFTDSVLEPPAFPAGKLLSPFLILHAILYSS